MFCGRRPVEPWKMTSSIRAPRSTRGLCSPSTQRTASEMFDFPQPLGPITAVTPGSTEHLDAVGERLEPGELETAQLHGRNPTRGPSGPALPVEVRRLSRYAAWSGDSNAPAYSR